MNRAVTTRLQGVHTRKLGILAILLTVSAVVLGTTAAALAVSGGSAAALSPARPSHSGESIAGSNGSSIAGPNGYWLAASDGGIFSYGGAHYYGSMGDRTLNRPVVGMAGSPDGRGYWLVASDGGVFSFGDAQFYGSTGGLVLNLPVVAMASTPDGKGYWLVASDGGIFAFGDASFHGSTGGELLNRPVVDMTASPDGNGYWLVASDGGVFSFGDAAFHGSAGGRSLVSTVSAIGSTAFDQGYWLAAGDGGVFPYGDASFHGSAAGAVTRGSVVALAATPMGTGYWLTASDGAVFAFGDAPFFGSAGSLRLNRPVVGMAPSATPAPGPAISKTSLSLSTDTVTHGFEQSATFTTMVTSQFGATPTGTVTVSTGGITLCTVALPAQSCSTAPGTLNISGTAYPVSATYSGDSKFLGSTSASRDLTIASMPSVTTTSLSPATQTQTDYSAPLGVIGGSGSIQWAVTSGVLPTGLFLDPVSGVINSAVGTGEVDPMAQTETFIVQATDASGAVAHQVLTIVVYAVPVITTTSLAPAKATEIGYSQMLSVTGGAPDLSWSVTTGALPAGLSLDSISGMITGTVRAGAQSSAVTVTVADANGVVGTADFTLAVTDPFVSQISTKPTGTASTFVISLPNGVSSGHALVLSLSQLCTTTGGVVVNSQVTTVTGGTVIWQPANSTGCSANGDAEIWYGLGTSAAAPGSAAAKVTVTLAAAADVQFVNVTEYSGVTSRDTTSGANVSGSGTASTVTPGPINPFANGELVVSDAFVNQPTPSSLTGLVNPFAPLNLISPFRGFGTYAVDATTAAVTSTYTQTSAGAPATGSWAAVTAAFTVAP
jgi:hypothetical protein